jgi:Cu-Zn family superoxide dismutase
MRTASRLTVGIILFGGAIGWTHGRVISADGGALRARAVIYGAAGSGIIGVVRFTQALTDAGLPESTVDIVARVVGLSSGLHGIHIHEVGSCADTTAAFGGAGGHFDAGPFGNSGPDINHPFHMGDIPNLDVDPSGVGRLRHTTSRITLSPGPLSVFDADGSAVIVHLNEDQGVTGLAGSGLSGGVRLACGVIEPL